LATSSAELWQVLAAEAAEESPLWSAALRPEEEWEAERIFSPLAQEKFALGLETIYEGYLLHYGRPRLFAPPDPDNALLLGDYLYAHGLVRFASFQEVEAVTDLSELISLCAQLRAEGADGDRDGAVWAATAALLGRGPLGPGRDALRLQGNPGPLLALAEEAAGSDTVADCLTAHRRRVR
jgi:hypothetical protein